jgi:hypothetical protein
VFWGGVSASASCTFVQGEGQIGIAKQEDQCLVSLCSAHWRVMSRGPFKRACEATGEVARDPYESLLEVEMSHYRAKNAGRMSELNLEM